VAGSLAAGSQTDKAPRTRGLAHHGRSEAPPLVIGLAVTRDGWPVRHWVLPGPTVEVSPMAQVPDDRRGWPRSRGVVVGDAGRVSPDTRKKLGASGGHYILCMPRRRGAEVTHAVRQRPGRSQQVTDNVRVTAVVVGEGERRRRDVVCHNPHEETRQRAHRQPVRGELEAELAALHEVRGERQSKRVCPRRASRRSGRYRRLTTGGLLRIDAAQCRSEAQLDGTCVGQSHDDSLSPADLAWGYTPRQRVEEAWRPRTSGLRVRPVSHWAVHRLHAPVALRGLAW
jgi:hypothetical protein